MTESILQFHPDASSRLPLTEGFEEGATAADQAPATQDKPINILIVDDEPKNLTVLETVLDDPSYRLVKAQSADEALLALLSDEFALLILDIRMPSVTGFELAQLIKTRKKTSRVPIIFLTAYYNEDQHVIEGYDTGAVDYLHKPVNPAILRSKVAVFAELHRKSRELGTTNTALLAEVTERRRAEEQLRDLADTLENRIAERTQSLQLSEGRLRESERRFREMIDALPTAVYTTDADGLLTHFNPASAEFSGRTPVVGSDRWCISWKLFDVDGRPLPPDQCPLAVALREGRLMRDSEAILERPDGTRLWVTSYPTPMRNEDGEIVGGINIIADITDRHRAEEHIRLLMNEVSHRSKNLLSVVVAIAQQTAAASPQEFTQRFSNRVQSLAASHDLLIKSDWQSIEIYDLIRAQLAHFNDLIGHRIILDGPTINLAVATAQSIGLVLHELATNAAKHGALSDQAGNVAITWRIETCEGKQQFTISWIERDGPPITAPKRRGFGTTVIKNMAEMSLDGDVQLTYAQAGFSWELTCPLKKVIKTADTNIT